MAVAKLSLLVREIDKVVASEDSQLVVLLDDLSGSPVPVPVRALHRLAVHIRQAQVDGELAIGRSPDRNVVLSLRARVLESAQARRRLAWQLMRILDDAWSGSARSGLPVPVCRERVRGNSRDLVGHAGWLLAAFQSRLGGSPRLC